MDPITFEVIRNALVAATEEMVSTLRRSAYSTNIKTRADFSCAFFDGELRAVAQASPSPCTSARWSSWCRARSATTAPRTSSRATCSSRTSPFPSGVHLNDIALISPVHHAGELLGYVANLAHHVDVGGGAPASIGAFREVFQEGVIIPPVKVVAGGPIVRDIFAPDPGADPLEARDGGRLPRPDRRERDRRPPAAGARRPPRPRDGRRARCASCSTTPSGERGPRSPRCRTASTRRRAPSTWTATRTSRCGSGRGSRSRTTASPST